MSHRFDLKKTTDKINFLVVFVLVLMVVFVFMASKFINRLVTQKLEVPSLPTLPAYLDTPLPDIKNIEKVLQQPKLDELRYEPEIFAPVVPGVKGKTNPFLP